MSGPLTVSQETLTQAASLLAEAGVSATILSGTLCTQGRNNQTYKIDTTQGPYIVKKYLRQASDVRDRLASEFTFLSYAKPIATKTVPTPIYQDVKQAMALYEFIDGQPLQPEEVTTATVKQAAAFFCALNDPATRIKAQNLPPASEACFSIQEHLELISARIAHLEKIAQITAEDKAAAILIKRLKGYWQQLVAGLTQVILEPRTALARNQRCISPSDFGFHNALKKNDGTLCFVDFEYAGWDDPAKMTGDFFSQLALPVPGTLFDSFVEEVMQPFAQPETLICRARYLRLVYRVKWCCIALNIFLPTHLARYCFANPALDVEEFKRKQLLKAETLIQSLEAFNDGLH